MTLDRESPVARNMGVGGGPEVRGSSHLGADWSLKCLEGRGLSPGGWRGLWWR